MGNKGFSAELVISRKYINTFYILTDFYKHIKRKK